ncbi:hypothetical protein Q1695_007977 [Nippostrongylus brasiliensis]|nr:hypothetical protein Q1695_007977 [Nippostrongylus brasiliensis]
MLMVTCFKAFWDRTSAHKRDAETKYLEVVSFHSKGLFTKKWCQDLDFTVSAKISELKSEKSKGCKFNGDEVKCWDSNPSKDNNWIKQALKEQKKSERNDKEGKKHKELLQCILRKLPKMKIPKPEGKKNDQKKTTKREQQDKTKRTTQKSTTTSSQSPTTPKSTNPATTSHHEPSTEPTTVHLPPTSAPSSPKDSEAKESTSLTEDNANMIIASSNETTPQPTITPAMVVAGSDQQQKPETKHSNTLFYIIMVVLALVHVILIVFLVLAIRRLHNHRKGKRAKAQGRASMKRSSESQTQPLKQPSNEGVDLWKSSGGNKAEQPKKTE